VADALSWLESENVEPHAEDLDTLDLVDVFHNDAGNPDFPDIDPRPVYSSTHVDITPEYKDKLKKGYSTDPILSRIIEQLQNNDLLGESEKADPLPYVLRNDLLYSIDGSKFDPKERLCIPDSLVKDVLEIAHDVMGHGGYKKLLSRLDNVSIWSCTKRVKEYVRHCPDCLRNETR
jgi:hypothetical protein